MHACVREVWAVFGLKHGDWIRLDGEGQVYPLHYTKAWMVPWDHLPHVTYVWIISTTCI